LEPWTSVTEGKTRYSHVITVGISAVNIRKSMLKNKNPALLKVFFASLPISRYSSPISMPTTMCEARRSRVKLYNEKHLEMLPSADDFK
jgi:hypothetical protein